MVFLNSLICAGVSAASADPAASSDAAIPAATPVRVDRETEVVFNGHKFIRVSIAGLLI